MKPFLLIITIATFLLTLYMFFSRKNGMSKKIASFKKCIEDDNNKSGCLCNNRNSDLEEVIEDDISKDSSKKNESEKVVKKEELENVKNDNNVFGDLGNELNEIYEDNTVNESKMSADIINSIDSLKNELMEGAI